LADDTPSTNGMCDPSIDADLDLVSAETADAVLDCLESKGSC
jgi:hypothetical protein